MIYIDFDWNIVNIWDEDKLIKSEKALILRDLLTKKNYCNWKWHWRRDEKA
ncbi:hypothetical protein MCCPILRI181_00921 [Mycoplasma capricolum subsp. capripneumoniae]|nr:hypothetical protein Mccp14020TZ_09240 [Mycoplasma capricolum subsp. capripneumoniae]CEA11261.1 hypothetical protein MCCPILRI181_00921 [Mycoplasma capricolum subsp. capripneumoniae]CEA12259.1 hypothetical protein MCCPF38_00921 [Mycoplasma capricolum subsp. capripneumoniae]